MRGTTIPAARAWNTWSALPAELVFLPLGVSLAPVGFAASIGPATLYPAGPTTRLGRHEIDGAVIELDMDHAGTRLRWSYAKADPYVVTGAWQATALGEWGCGSGSICACAPPAASRPATTPRPAPRPLRWAAGWSRW